MTFTDISTLHCVATIRQSFGSFLEGRPGNAIFTYYLLYNCDTELFGSAPKKHEKLESFRKRWTTNTSTSFVQNFLK